MLLRGCHKLPSDNLAVLLSHAVVHRSPSFLFGEKTYSDRIALRRLRPDPAYAMLTDKVEVRKFVADRIGREHLVPLYDVVDAVDTFDFAALPAPFVMKATHGSGWVKLVSEPALADADELRSLARCWLSSNFYNCKVPPLGLLIW